MKSVLALLVVAMMAAACGDDNPSLANPDGMGSGSGSGSDATLTSYVIDLVMNHTTATELPKPYADFSALPDPDGDMNNGSAYAPLFP